MCNYHHRLATARVMSLQDMAPEAQVTGCSRKKVKGALHLLQTTESARGNTQQITPTVLRRRPSKEVGPDTVVEVLGKRVDLDNMLTNAPNQKGIWDDSPSSPSDIPQNANVVVRSTPKPVHMPRPQPKTATDMTEEQRKDRAAAIKARKAGRKKKLAVQQDVSPIQETAQTPQGDLPYTPATPEEILAAGQVHDPEGDRLVREIRQAGGDKKKWKHRRRRK